MPAEGTVIGEVVSVAKIDYDGNPQRGLRATCRKEDGKMYGVSLADVAFPDGSIATTNRTISSKGSNEGRAANRQHLRRPRLCP